MNQEKHIFKMMFLISLFIKPLQYVTALFIYFLHNQLDFIHLKKK
jgi:hypothetical protein